MEYENRAREIHGLDFNNPGHYKDIAIKKETIKSIGQQIEVIKRKLDKKCEEIAEQTLKVDLAQSVANSSSFDLRRRTEIYEKRNKSKINKTLSSLSKITKNEPIVKNELDLNNKKIEISNEIEKLNKLIYSKSIFENKLRELNTKIKHLSCEIPKLEKEIESIHEEIKNNYTLLSNIFKIGSKSSSEEIKIKCNEFEQLLIKKTDSSVMLKKYAEDLSRIEEESLALDDKKQAVESQLGFLHRQIDRAEERSKALGMKIKETKSSSGLLGLSRDKKDLIKKLQSERSFNFDLIVDLDKKLITRTNGLREIEDQITNLQENAAQLQGLRSRKQQELVETEERLNVLRSEIEESRQRTLFEKSVARTAGMISGFSSYIWGGAKVEEKKTPEGHASDDEQSL